MKSLKARRAAQATLAGALILASTTLEAADFPQRTALARRSAAQGVGRAEVELLVRSPGPGSAPTETLLLQRFARPGSTIVARGTTERQVDRDHVLLSGADWSLSVSGDGSKVRYRTSADRRRENRLARPVAQRLSPRRLETLGRTFIASELRGLVRLGPGESLVPLFTQHEITGGGSTVKGVRPVAEKVVASTVVFGRAVDGVSVVGPGSKVAITFANDGKPIGFDYDWPVYERTGRIQRVLPPVHIHSRAGGVLAARPGSEGVTVKRFECGYFDAGARRHDPQALVQAACSYQYSKRTIVDPELHRKDPASGHVTSAFIEAIPAGQTVERDAGWSQAARVRGETLPGPPVSSEAAPLARQ
jgi:hypothetical protein